MTTSFPALPDSKRLAARDRVLLYTRGMDIEPEDGIRLALESMRKAGDGAGPEKVMEELFTLLRENGRPPLIPDPDGTTLVSSPPVHRQTVLPKDMDPLSFSAALAKWVSGLARGCAGKGENAS
ncbi:MAG: hypothetical protein LIP28_09360 [Deltaproteobacteria bacterium]|nr:hypothetical protein [Deltaproteobacteria bacterium]